MADLSTASDLSAVALPLRPQQVLVIDDQAAVRQGLARLISAAPHGPREVHTAANGTEALLLLQRTRPTLVVLDVDLAGDDGLALMPALRACARVLVLTSHGDVATRNRALQLGADAFVEKTAPASVLLAHLARLASVQPAGDKAPWPAGQASRPGPG